MNAQQIKLFSSRGSDEYSTPQDFFNKLNDEFKFDIDVAASDEFHKCAKYYTIRDDALTKDWNGRVFCNPPYSKVKEFLKKGKEEIEKGNSDLIVFLIFANTDTDFFHTYCVPFSGINSNNKDYVWSAGLFDGEGCVFIRKNNPIETSKYKNIRYDLGIKVSMTSKETIDRLYNIFKKGYLSIEEKKEENHKTAYIWTARSNDAFDILKLIYPFLITKKEEAYHAINFSLLEKSKQGKLISEELMKKRENYYWLLRDLKKEITIKNAHDVELRFIKGRLKFLGKNSKGILVNNPAMRPSMLVIMKSKK